MQKRILGLIGIIVLWSSLAEASVVSLPRYTGDISSRYNEANIGKTEKLSCAERGKVDKPSDSCQKCVNEYAGCCDYIECSTDSNCYQYTSEDAKKYTCSERCTDRSGTHYKTCKYRLTCADFKELTQIETTPYTSAGFECWQTFYSCAIQGTSLGVCVLGSIADGALGGISSGDKQSITCYMCRCPIGTSTSPETGKECTVSHQVGNMKCYTCGCPAGTYGEDCKACPAGSYSSTAGASTCQGCPAGYGSKTGVTGATSQEAACSICPQGTYKANIGQGSCTACPTGYDAIAGVSGATSVTQACARSCVPCDRASYPLSSCPAHAICEECTPKYCDNTAKSYKITSCEGGYALSGNACKKDSGAIKFVIDTRLNKSLSFNVGNATNINFNINWGDETQENIFSSGTVSHTYASSGKYTITIEGNLPEMGEIKTKNVVELKQLNLSTVKAFKSTFIGQEKLTGTIPALPKTLMDGSYMFAGCSNLTGTIPALPDSLTNGEDMFGGCSGLTRMTSHLPTNLTNGYSMFSGCSGLTGSIPALPDSLTVGRYMFSSCSNLTGTIPPLPDSLTDGEGMFSSCSGLTGSIPALPSSLGNGWAMFSGCSGLTGPIPPLPDSLTDGTSMFYDCSGLTGMTSHISTSLTNGPNMFHDCRSLTGTIPALPDSLKTGTNMFKGCSSLTGTIPALPDSLNGGNHMFDGCSGLTGMTSHISTSLTYGNSMFYGCRGLTGTIPALPKHLVDGSHMFDGCSKLTGKSPKKPSGINFYTDIFRGTQVTNDGSWPSDVW